MKKNDPIVVTGANGLAGSAVVEHLRSQLFTCVIGLGREQCDLMDSKATLEKFTLIKPAYVFHAAATVYGLGGNMRNQGKSIYENTMINANIIEACRAAEVRKLTVMGTNAIYPASAELPYSEADIFNGRPHVGESGYGNAKRHMLAMLEAYESSYGLKYSYLVSGNLYGPRDRFDPINGHVLPTLIWKFHHALTNDDPVEIWGDGSPRRDFLYSADLARIVERVMFDDVVGTLNIGGGSTYTIREIVWMLCSISGVSPGRIVFNPEKPNGRLNCESDLSRLKSIGIWPGYMLPIEPGLKKTWDWYCEQQHSARTPFSSN